MELAKQKLLVEYLLSSPELYAICHSVLQPWYFDDTMKNVINFSQTYFEKYKTVPKADQVKAETGTTIELKTVTKSDIGYVSEEIESFCRKKALEKAIINSVDLLEKGDYGKVESLIKEAVAIGLTKDLGINYFENPEIRLQDTEQNYKPISSGYTELDEHLNGGFFREELTLLMANSGVGKSIMLTNLSANIIKQGYNVLYISLELAERVVARRFDSIITGVPQKSILTNKTKVATELSNIQPNYGSLFIKRMPESTTNANAVRAYLKQFYQAYGFNPDAIVLDYLDIMTTNHRIPADALFVKDKYMTEEARSLGFEFNATILTASQMGRAALNATSEEINQGHIQGGISKVNTADNLLAIFQSEQMKMQGEYGIAFAKTRNSGATGKVMFLRWNDVTLKVSNLNEGLQLKNKKKEAVVPVEGTIFDKENKSAKSLLEMMK